MKKINEILKCIILILLYFINIQFFCVVPVSVIAQEKESQVESASVDPSSEDDEVIYDSDITTKIFKSTDPSVYLLEEESNFDSPFQEDILTKEELLSGKNMLSLNESDNVKTNVKLASKQNILKPWLYLFFVFLVLYLIFKLMKIKKIR